MVSVNPCKISGYLMSTCAFSVWLLPRLCQIRKGSMCQKKIRDIDLKKINQESGCMNAVKREVWASFL